MILDTNAVSGLLEGHAALEALLARKVRHELPVIVIEGTTQLVCPRRFDWTAIAERSPYVSRRP
jgi:hypothetical protein